MRCPQCKHRINPLKLLQVSRWTYIKCPGCGAELGRKINLLSIALAGIMGMCIALVANTLISHFDLVRIQAIGIATVLVFLPYFLIDAATVQLVSIKGQEIKNTTDEQTPVI